MFVTRELIVDAEFGAARERLKQIVRAADGAGLTGMSRQAYEQTLTRLTSDDASGDPPVVSTLVDVRLKGPVKRDDTRVVWLRWEAAGEASGLLPTLDAQLQPLRAPEDPEWTATQCLPRSASSIPVCDRPKAARRCVAQTSKSGDKAPHSCA